MNFSNKLNTSGISIDMPELSLSIPNNAQVSHNIYCSNIIESADNHLDLLWDFAVKDINSKDTKVKNNNLNIDNIWRNEAYSEDSFFNNYYSYKLKTKYDNYLYKNSLVDSFKNSFFTADEISIPIKNKSLSFLCKEISLNKAVINYESLFEQINLLIDDKILDNFTESIDKIDFKNYKIDLNIDLVDINKEIDTKIFQVKEMLKLYEDVLIKLYIKKKLIDHINNLNQFNLSDYLNSYEDFSLLIKQYPINNFFLNKEYLIIYFKYFLPLLKDSQISLDLSSEFIYKTIQAAYELNYRDYIINSFNKEFYEIFITLVLNKYSDKRQLEYCIHYSYAGKIILHNEYLFKFFQNAYNSHLFLEEL